MNVPAQILALAAALTHLWIFTMESVRFSRYPRSNHPLDIEGSHEHALLACGG